MSNHVYIKRLLSIQCREISESFSSSLSSVTSIRQVVISGYVWLILSFLQNRSRDFCFNCEGISFFSMIALMRLVRIGVSSSLARHRCSVVMHAQSVTFPFFSFWIMLHMVSWQLAAFYLLYEYTSLQYVLLCLLPFNQVTGIKSFDFSNALYNHTSPEIEQQTNEHYPKRLHFQKC